MRSITEERAKKWRPKEEREERLTNLDIDTLQNLRKRHAKIAYLLRKRLQKIEKTLKKENRQLEKLLIKEAEEQGRIRLVETKKKKPAKAEPKTLREFWDNLSQEEQELLRKELHQRKANL